MSEGRGWREVRKRTEDPFLFLILSLVHILKGRNKYVTGLQQENDFIQLAGRYMTEWKWISVYSGILCPVQ